MNKTNPSNPQRIRAFSLLECMMLVLILGIVGVGAGQALQTVAKTPSQTDQQLTNETTAVSAMEYMRSIPYSNLETIAGYYNNSNLQISVAYADPTGGNYPNLNFKKITVTSNGLTLTTLVCKP